jgi:hypothetical protein
MTAPRNTELMIKAYLADGPDELPDRSFESVRDTIERTRQRGPFGGWTLPRLSQSARILILAALVLAAVVGVSLIAPGGQPNLSGPDASADPSSSTTDALTSSEPSAAPTAEPPPSADPTATPAAQATPGPGTFRVSDGFPVDATFDYPPGWSDCSDTPLEQGVCRGDGAGLSLMIIDNVVADPCIDQGLDPPVGPTIDDLATAIAGLPGFDATVPIDITVDGHPAKELTVTAPGPAEATCNLFTWSNSLRTNGVGAGEVNRLRIVDVDGVRVLIALAFFPASDEPEIPADTLAILDAVRFP